jgi:hypothetical protein
VRPATGVWDRTDSSGRRSRCTPRAMYSSTPVPSLTHGPLAHGRNGTEQIHIIWPCAYRGSSTTERKMEDCYAIRERHEKNEK